MLCTCMLCGSVDCNEYECKGRPAQVYIDDDAKMHEYKLEIAQLKKEIAKWKKIAVCSYAHVVAIDGYGICSKCGWLQSYGGQDYTEKISR